MNVKNLPIQYRELNLRYTLVNDVIEHIVFVVAHNLNCKLNNTLINRSQKQIAFNEINKNNIIYRTNNIAKYVVI